MENMMNTTDENEIKQFFAAFTKVIDGRSFVVRAFFPVANAGTMQDKIERMLHSDIVNAVRQSAT